MDTRSAGRRPPHPSRRLLVRGLVLSLLAFTACAPAAPAPSSAPPAAARPGGAQAAAPAAQAPAQPAAQAAPPALTPLRIAFTTNSAINAPLWLAHETGLFREQGLDSSLQFITAGAPMSAAVRNGEVDFVVGAGGPTIIQGVLAGVDHVVVGSKINILTSAVYVIPSIQRPEDLRGGVVATSRFKAIADVAGRQGLLRLGLQADRDFSVVQTGGIPEAMAALETGAVQAATITSPITLKARQLGFRELVDVTALRIPFFTSTLSTSRRYLADQPDPIDRALRTMALGIQRYRADKATVMQVVAQYIGVTDPELLEEDYQSTQPIFQPDLAIDPTGVQAALELEDNPAARTAKFEDFIDTRPLDRLRASGFFDRLGS